MGILIVKIASITTLIYVLAIGCLAWQLKRTPRPYTDIWCSRYVRILDWVRASLWIAIVLFGVSTVFFFFPMLLRGSGLFTVNVFGVIDLLCTLMLYGMRLWASRLQDISIIHIELPYM